MNSLPCRYALLKKPGDFEPQECFYPRCLNAQIHPLVSSFFNLGNDRIILRYCHLNPVVNETKLRDCLRYTPSHFRWAGTDLFNVTNAHGQRQMIIVETNSCPSGQKSMPLLSDIDEHGGYHTVLSTAFQSSLSHSDPELGGLAVIYDKNEMEATGYATVMADLTHESVWMAEFYDSDPNPPVKWENGILYVRDKENVWHSIRACFRYVTKAPWNRIPLKTRTLVLNNIISCLAGGRNKMMAARAYELFNAEMAGTGLMIRTPETLNNISKSEIPLIISSWGGHAVVKVPYSNAGQGVYIITNQKELQDFMHTEHRYDKFIVQSLIGNASWSSVTREGMQYHIGNIPDKKGKTFVSDLRCMVTVGDVGGFQPVAIYARRARKPLLRKLDDDPLTTSWEMLGTNLSVKLPDGSFSTESKRLVLMDRKDFNTLGISLDDLIEGYVQTVLSVIAIDKLAKRLINVDTGEFDMELFRALNPDDRLLEEIM
ncbi:hypothetical protein PNEG_00967 [Pneumocystis murina B123]|uniref:Uncharacterized protein n=1 Tax=Pneumocystis murina (strain B123) TaxID=1069680 RepID=M7PAF7_PNEMU|nr:hypothetical protein PNEG_00967 [Pneumocystis murina B123]EMR10820.1 hypothetical protein PNEG_00967 [Pneumocystis murina B123]